MPIIIAASTSFTINAFPYKDANVKARFGSRRYNSNGPVITMTPRITVGIVENRVINIYKRDDLKNRSVCTLFMTGTTINARYITPPIHNEAAKLCIKSMAIGIDLGLSAAP